MSVDVCPSSQAASMTSNYGVEAAATTMIVPGTIRIDGRTYHRG